MVDDPLIRSDLDSGLQFLVRSQIDSNGTLCCGETGKADILLEAGRRLARPELISLAQDRASAVAAGVASSDTSMLLLGLFQGLQAWDMDCYARPRRIVSPPFSCGTDVSRTTVLQEHSI